MMTRKVQNDSSRSYNSISEGGCCCFGVGIDMAGNSADKLSKNHAGSLRTLSLLQEELNTRSSKKQSRVTDFFQTNNFIPYHTNISAVYRTQPGWRDPSSIEPRSIEFLVLYGLRYLQVNILHVFFSYNLILNKYLTLFHFSYFYIYASFFELPIYVTDCLHFCGRHMQANILI